MEYIHCGTPHVALFIHVFIHCGTQLGYSNVLCGTPHAHRCFCDDRLTLSGIVVQCANWSVTDLRNWAAAAKTRSDPIFWGICDCFSTQTGTLEKGQMPYLLNLTLIYCLQLTTKAATLTADMAIRITLTGQLPTSQPSPPITHDFVSEERWLQKVP